jgi:hypothetical protein
MTSLRALFASLLVAAPLAGPLAAQAPRLPAASPPPPAPVEAPRLLAPPANAVAQCGDFTFVVAPATPAVCESRGGVKVVLPGARAAAPATGRTAPAAPALRATAPQPAATLRDAAPPAGATMRCRDGSWLTGTPNASRCDRNGGLAVILPSTPPAPTRTP